VRPLFTDLRMQRAPDRDRETGLLAYLRLTLPGDIQIDGITLRRGRDQRLLLGYPKRRGARGEEHPIVRPTTPAARAEFEAAVISELRARGEIE